MMDLLELVQNTIRAYRLLEPGEAVIVGFSGGVDSAVLLTALEKLGYPVHAVHVEHGIRGEESLRDASFSENFCRERSIPFTLLRCDAPAVAKAQKLSLEDAARQERYRLLGETAASEQKKIAVAHHLDDQAETVLMHLLRGSGLAGLGGMYPQSGNIIRPLLDTPRDAIIRYAEEQQIPYCTDSSNDDLAFTRNRLRQTVMPHLIAFRPDACERIADCARILRAWQTHEDVMTASLFDQIAAVSGNKVILPCLPMDPPMIYALSKKAIETLRRDTKDITGAHFRAIAALWSNTSGSETALPGGVRVRRSFQSIEFFYEAPARAYSYSFEPCRHYAWNGKTLKSRFVFALGKKKGTYIDFDALPPNTQLRTRQSSDRIHPLGAPGSMTLKKFFINKKIPQDERARLPLLACGHEILAVFGITVSERAKVTERSQKILYIFEGEDT